MKMHRYTKEEHSFMKDFVPGHSYKEIAEEFTRRFGWEISIGQVNSYIGNHKLNTGRTGRFEKGMVSHNKGKKGVCAKGCEKGWFKKRNIPVNHRPVGSERITRDGYIEVKIAEPNKWKLKHRVVFEEANGPIPRGKIIIFKDNNRLNTDLDNLIMITRGENAILNHTKMSEYAGEAKETAIVLAHLMKETHKAKKSRKNDGMKDVKRRIRDH